MTKKSSPSYLPPLCLLCLILYIYLVYLLLVLIPQLAQFPSLFNSSVDSNQALSSTPSFSFIITLLILFHITLIMFLASFYQAMFTPPGSIPRETRWEEGNFDCVSNDDFVTRLIDNQHAVIDENTKEALRKTMVVERKHKKDHETDDADADNERNKLIGASNVTFNAAASEDLKRKCHTCMMYKPDRCHHCSVCNSCVLRMDHHCPWIASCVGFRNYKYFCLLLFYGWLSAALLIVATVHRFLRVFRPILNVSYFLTTDLLIAIAFIAVCLLFIALFSFSLFHFYLTLNALSTIEYREKKNSSSPATQRRWLIAHYKYDQSSLYHNFCHVYGQPYQWLFPVDPRPKDDGTYSTKILNMKEYANLHEKQAFL